MNLRRVLTALVVLLIFVSPLAARSLKNKAANDTPQPTAISADIVKMGKNAAVPAGMTVNSAVAFGGSVQVAGEVLKDVVAIGGSVVLKPTAKIGGNAVSIGGIVKKDPGAVVAGEIMEVIMSKELMPMTAVGSQVGPGVIYMAAVFASLLAFLSILALSITTGALFPRRVGWTSAAIERNPIKAFLWGALWMILALPIMGLLLVSVIGIPLILLEILVFGLAMMLGYVSVTQLLGKKLLSGLRRYNQPMVAEIVWGVALLTLLGVVPVLGAVINSIVLAMSIGGSWMSRLGEGA